jgi:hypothetical protein
MKIPAALLLLLVSSGCAVVPSLSVTPRFGPLDIDGDVLVSSVGAAASSSVDGLGLDSENVLSPRVDFAWGPADIMLSSTQAEYSGRGTAESELDLGGMTVNLGDPVRSALDLSILAGLATFDFIPTDLIDLGLGIGASIVDFDAEVEALDDGAVVGSDEKFLIPVLAARAGTELGPFTLSLHANGLTGKYDDVEATYVDLDLAGEYSFEEMLGFYAALVVGYRTTTLDVEYEDQGSDIEADLEFSGVYFGLTVGI